MLQRMATYVDEFHNQGRKSHPPQKIAKSQTQCWILGAPIQDNGKDYFVLEA